MSENKEIIPKGNAMGYKFTIILMAAIIAVLLWLLFTSKQLVTEAVVEKENLRVDLTGELDSLMTGHKLVQNEYGELTAKMSEKDSIIFSKSQEIKKLISSKADYYQIKRKLEYLRKITQSYVDQIDSLFTVNTKLKEEVTAYKSNLNSEKAKTTSLSLEKENLTNIINTAASDIPAYNIKGKTFHLKGKTNKEVETYKANRVDRVNICFTIGQNLVAKPGNKTVYIRISRPDKLIISNGQGNEYSFEAGGTRLQFSLKREIDYQNKAIDVCANWDKRTETPAMEGTYEVTIWLDGKQIGTTSFKLE